MQLPKSWTEVTPLSKNIALILFIAMPIFGFYFGYEYHRLIALEESTISRPNPISGPDKPELPQRTATPTTVRMIEPTLSEARQSPQPIPTVKLISTADWQSISTGAFSIKAPNDLAYYAFGKYQLGLFPGPKPEGLQVLSVERRGQVQLGSMVEYKGGSRRDWWLRENQGDSDHPMPKYTFVEKKYGNNEGLEVSWDGEKRTILVAKGTRMYIFTDNSYGDKWEVLETIVSTFKEN